MSGKISKYEGTRYYPSLFNRLFDDDFFSDFVAKDVPAVNIKETAKGFKLEISAAGFEKGDFNIEVDKNILKISASKEFSSEEKGEDEKILRQEFSSSAFTRSFTLPENIETEKIEAKEKSGILTVKLPKKEYAAETAVRKIEIK